MTITPRHQRPDQVIGRIACDMSKPDETVVKQLGKRADLRGAQIERVDARAHRLYAQFEGVRRRTGRGEESGPFADDPPPVRTLEF